MLADWMYWVTAIVFTVVGFTWGLEFNKQHIISITIDSLIEQGYIKTRGFGRNKEMLKYDEEQIMITPFTLFHVTFVHPRTCDLIYKGVMRYRDAMKFVEEKEKQGIATCVELYKRESEQFILWNH